VKVVLGMTGVDQFVLANSRNEISGPTLRGHTALGNEKEARLIELNVLINVALMIKEQKNVPSPLKRDVPHDEVRSLAG